MRIDHSEPSFQSIRTRSSEWKRIVWITSMSLKSNYIGVSFNKEDAKCRINREISFSVTSKAVGWYSVTERGFWDWARRTRLKKSGYGYMSRNWFLFLHFEAMESKWGIDEPFFRESNGNWGAYRPLRWLPYRRDVLIHTSFSVLKKSRGGRACHSWTRTSHPSICWCGSW